MIHFRIRDYLSVLLYRTIWRPYFGRFGRRVRVVWPLRIVGARHVHLADDVTISSGAYVAVLPATDEAPGLIVGRGSRVGNHAHIIATRRIEIGEQVLIADRVYLSDNLHQYHDPQRPIMEQPLRQTADLVIGAGSWIGENACLIGCAIGRHCAIGANSVVTRDLPDYSVAAGAPAIIVRRYCAETGRWRRTLADGNFAE